MIKGRETAAAGDDRGAGVVRGAGSLAGARRVDEVVAKLGGPAGLGCAGELANLVRWRCRCWPRRGPARRAGAATPAVRTPTTCRRDELSGAPHVRA